MSIINTSPPVTVTGLQVNVTVGIVRLYGIIEF